MIRYLPFVIAVIAALSTSTKIDDKPLVGFTEKSASEQYALETRMDQMMDAENLNRWMQRMTSAPQHVGSPQAKANAEFVAELYRSWGYEAEIVVYHVLFPTPVRRSLELISPSTYSAKLQEASLKEDPSTQRTEDALPPFNAYSADGDVTAELVYVNQGIPRDYEELARRGISVEGKVVIARYGGSWRGIKPKVAYEHGAVGCILYSDPRDDGYSRGDVYPVGPFKNATGTQRGSVADMPLYPGDPLTPFRGATEDAERLDYREAPTVMKIPVLPISYEDAQPLLAAIGGDTAPSSWVGGLPITYHIGPGPARVRLNLKFNWDIKPAYNVIAKLTGSEYPDQWIMRGNHRDAWVFGAQDPTSGHVAMMEEARVIGELAKSGHRPKRTIVYGSWDAEEPGLLGSTEWVEHNQDELREKLAVYINTDSNGRGFLGMGGSHSLERFINQVARDVVDPQTGVSVLERKRARDDVAAVDRGSERASRSGDYRISPLGSGSDYTPFLQHLGIASLNLGYGGESSGGSYHSLYDTYEYYRRFGDPDFAYGIALAQTAGRATLRLANADVLPLRFSNFADNVSTYLNQVQELVESRRAEAERVNELVEDSIFTLALDPTKSVVPPSKRETVPYFNFAPIENAIASVRAEATKYDAMLETGSLENPGAINAILVSQESRLSDSDGLPGRPWFRHMIYAPGFYTGYGVKTLPGIREAIEQDEFELVEDETERIARALERYADGIRRAREASL